MTEIIIDHQAPSDAPIAQGGHPSGQPIF